VRKVAGKCGLIQRCQVHKIRNVVDHLTEDYQMATRCKMRNAYLIERLRNQKDVDDAIKFVNRGLQPEDNSVTRQSLNAMLRTSGGVFRKGK